MVHLGAAFHPLLQRSPVENIARHELDALVLEPVFIAGSACKGMHLVAAFYKRIDELGAYESRGSCYENSSGVSHARKPVNSPPAHYVLRRVNEERTVNSVKMLKKR